LKDKAVLPRYAYHQLLVQDFRSKANSGSQPFVSYGMLNKVEVPVPSISEQKRISEVLDKFDALVNDISIGLPAEIEGRRKQYEYYRNKLLAFKMSES
jgi:type I restriction enzyme S subunit